MSDANLLRLILLVAGLIVLAVIYFTGRGRSEDDAARRRERNGTRRDPVLSDAPLPDAEPGHAAAPVAAAAAEYGAASASAYGKRVDARFDRIVTVYVAAREGETLAGSDVVVAAEKVGLVFGHRDIFHRMVDGKPELAPVFSVANMLAPGHFEMASITQLQTPGVSFFMTLPGPLSALDAWDMMLPTAQRMAELLGAMVLDADRNALGRQGIGHIREDLRSYDRKAEQAQGFR
ncbi:MAG: cell division protein ZipA [Lysobacterales bacterium CG17_big_fil_post_rev_8_21_14_2_50_64_11]|nr:MAG: cell division protein ZipA [Xanthomonadales bacterium CG17_big_fil_post_rev_8_21_14_2_50_64_11]